MPPRIFQVSEYKEPIKQLLRDGLSVEDCAKQYPVSERTVWRYYKEVQDEKAGIVPEKKAATGVKPVKGTTEMAAITAKTPAPIIFRIGDQSIDLNPLDLLDAWRFCQDIKNMDPSIDDDFSGSIDRIAITESIDFSTIAG